jgi:hypothetical protein
MLGVVNSPIYRLQVSPVSGFTLPINDMQYKCATQGTIICITAAGQQIKNILVDRICGKEKGRCPFTKTLNIEP